MSDDDLYEVADFVGIDRDKMRRFLGVLRTMGAEIAIVAAPQGTTGEPHE